VFKFYKRRIFSKTKMVYGNYTCRRPFKQASWLFYSQFCLKDWLHHHLGCGFWTCMNKLCVSKVLILELCFKSYKWPIFSFFSKPQDVDGNYIYTCPFKHLNTMTITRLFLFLSEIRDLTHLRIWFWILYEWGTRYKMPNWVFVSTPSKPYNRWMFLKPKYLWYLHL
jgi:hypothetical protein